MSTHAPAVKVRTDRVSAKSAGLQIPGLFGGCRSIYGSMKQALETHTTAGRRFYTMARGKAFRVRTRAKWRSDGMSKRLTLRAVTEQELAE